MGTPHLGDYIVVHDEPIPPAQVERLRVLSSNVRLLKGLDKIREARVVYTGDAKFELADAPRLRWVQLNTAGIRQIVGTPLARSGLPVANARGAYTPPVAEFAIGLLISAARRFAVCHDLQRAARWVEDLESVRGTGLFGRTVAIVGYGNIGRHIARIAHSIGMRILACKRNPAQRREAEFSLNDIGDPEGVLPAEWFGADEIEAMFRTTDHAVVTLPLTPRTDKLIGRRELAALPSHALFVNVGRGEVVDEQALGEMLVARRLAGAALDVFAEEPLPPTSPLWRAPNTIVVPHLASFVTEQAALASEVLVENVRRDLAGEPLLNIVDFTEGY